MKKKICMILLSSVMAFSVLTGCGGSNQKQEQEEEQSINIYDEDLQQYFLTEEELPDNMYFIVREKGKGKKKETRYYPLYQAPNTFGGATDEEGLVENPSRIVWVNHDDNEALIPTMYEGDKIIYHSTTNIPSTYKLEKFFDDEYTFGMAGLYVDRSGNCRYDANNGGTTLENSDAYNLDTLSAETIYFVSTLEDKKGAKAKRITETRISDSGTVMGLEPMKQYLCDIRTGTVSNPMVLTSNIHMFSSAEGYKFSNFKFISEHIAQINFPEYVTTGYYMLGDGFFRYVKKDQNPKKLKAEDYNETIYVCDIDGKIVGTTVGYELDEESFLVKSLNPYNAESGTVMEDSINGIITRTYTIDKIDKTEAYVTNDESGTYYEFVATCKQPASVDGFRYYISEKEYKTAVLPVEGMEFVIAFTPDDGSILENSEKYNLRALSVKFAKETKENEENISGTENTEETTE